MQLFAKEVVDQIEVIKIEHISHLFKKYQNPEEDDFHYETYVSVLVHYVEYPNSNSII